MDDRALRPDGTRRKNFVDREFVATQRLAMGTCGYLGDKIPGEPCGSTGRRCNFDGVRCTPYHACENAQRNCMQCPYFTKTPEYPLLPVARTPFRRFDGTNLAPEMGGRRFNPSLIQWTRNSYILAWRHDWGGSNIYLSFLDADFNPRGKPIRLPLLHPTLAPYGREDPRLFMHNGEPYIAYIGVMGLIGPTNVLYARLDAQFNVAEIFTPNPNPRYDWEKNWQFFSHNRELYAVYDFAHHKILKINGNDTQWAYESPTVVPWEIQTPIRGGASPVLVGDEWWCWMHSRSERGGYLTYCMGLYTFENKPPFRVKRIVPRPILWADRSTHIPEHGKSVVFPCGAVYNRDHWYISMGVHDYWTEIHRYDHDEMDRQLIPVDVR